MPLPLDADAGRAGRPGPALQAAFSAAGMQLLGVRSRAIFPGRSSMTFSSVRVKGLLLSRATLGLAAELVEPCPAGRWPSCATSTAGGTTSCRS